MLDLTNLLSKVVTEGELPAELDLDFYRLVYNDLSRFDDAALTLHFEQYGRDEGRIASPAAHRVGFTATIPKHARVLEIGPFTRPVLRGENVRYFDVLDREGLISRARTHQFPTDNCPEIEYVSPTGDLSIVREKFQYLFSSHCIEHQPDLISHLHAAANVLEPGGMYYLIVPDKRYCFDHFIPESTVEDVIAAYVERRKVHTKSSVIAMRALTTHNNAAEHWRGNHDDPAFEQREARVTAAAQEFKDSGGEYIDVHAWRFVPQSFRRIIANIRETGLCDFTVERVYDALFEEFEFTAVLRANPESS